MVNYHFNLENFGLGLGVGWASAYALYRSRHLISDIRDSITQGASSARNIALSGADADYLRDLIKYIQADHLAGGRVPLSQIMVEPRFILAPRVVEPVEEDVAKSVFRVVPIVPDHPHLHAPYNIESLSVEELDNGDRFIAILGEPGSGRSTALHAIALWSIGEINFTPPKDRVTERMEAEERAIDNQKERAQRYKDRMQVEEQALNALEIKTGKEVDGKNEDGKNITPFRQMTPMYAHFGNISTSISEFGRNIDPAEPLVRAIQHYVGRVTSMKIPRNIYERLRQGRVLLLLDGFDELPEDQQAIKLNWLQAYVKEYKDNFIVMTAPITGYGKIVQMGAAPVFLRPWQDVTSSRLIDKWTEYWGVINGRGRRRAADLDPATIKRAKSRNRAMTPFELTSKSWAIMESPERISIQSWMDNLLVNLAPNFKLEPALPQLIQAAMLQLDMGFITAEHLEAKLTGAPPPPALSPEILDEEDAELDQFFDEFDASDQPASSGFDLGDLLGGEDVSEEVEAIQLPEPAAASTSDDKKSKIGKEYIQMLQQWHKAGLLTRFRGGRYQFRHHLLTSYLASMGLAEVSDDILLEKNTEPAWQYALAYATIHRPMDVIVNARLEAPTDVLFNNLLETSKWIKYASGKVDWLPKIFREMANMFVKESQYTGIRERVAAALVGTRDRNAMKVFARSLDHPDPQIRRLACLGVGALETDEAIKHLNRLLNDTDAEVKLSAGLALGAIGTEEALEAMVIALAEGEEPLRQAIAEAFAAIPEEGYPVLYDAINHEDMLLRRAAVFGLRRINTGWALVSLYRTSLEDDEWYVRSAAEQAFIEMQFGDTATGPRTYPQAEEIIWVRNWLTSLGDASKNIKAGGVELLRKALDEGDTETQRLSAVNLGLMGHADQIGVLYRSLRHRDERVREAAHRALMYLQLQIGKALPSPV